RTTSPPTSTPFPYTTLFRSFLQGTGTVQKAGEVRDIEVRRSRSRKGCGRGGSCLRFMGLAQELEEGGTGKRFLQDGTEPGPGIVHGFPYLLAGHGDHRVFIPHVPEFFQYLEAIDFRHLHIGQYQIGFWDPFLLEFLEAGVGPDFYVVDPADFP